MTNEETRVAPPICTHSLDAIDRLPDPTVIAGCPICWRRWRLAEARMRGWPPLLATEARPLLDRMAAEAAAGVDSDPALSRGFYAFLAASPDDEADFAAACVVACAPPRPDPPRQPPADFGWRAFFADRPANPSAPVPSVPATTITRIWQWREIAASGSATRRETRSFLRGESPPPFAPLPDSSATHWVRERAAYDSARADASTPLHQIVGPLALRLIGAGTAAALLTLRLRGAAGVESTTARLYGSAGVGVPLWSGTLSSALEEVAIPLDREISRAFTVEVDTAW